MPQKGSWMDAANYGMAYQYNGIERVDPAGFELGVNMAFYRTLDPALGQWWQVDPAAESFSPMSPYCAMGASPFVYNDPQGDFIGAAFAVGALTNAIIQSFSGNVNSSGDFWGSAAVGGTSAAIGYGVGQGLSSAFAGGSFASGFSGTSNVSAIGFTAGALSGAGAGFSGGFVGGFGSSLVNGMGVGGAFRNGLSSGVFGAFSGGISGGG